LVKGIGWNHELKTLRKKANKAFHTAYRTREQEDWDKHKEARRAFKRVLRKSKRESWHNFCTNLEKVHESARLYKLLGKSSDAQMGMLRLQNGEWTKTPEEEYEYLLNSEHPLPGCTTDKSLRISNTEFGKQKWIPSTNWIIASEIVTDDRIKWAFDAMSIMSLYKSPGEDGIFPALLEKGSKHILHVICQIYRASIACCYIPTAWRIARVTFLPKPGKSYYTRPKSF